MNDHRPSRGEVLRHSWSRFGEVVPEIRRPWTAALLWGGVTLGTAACLLFGATAAASYSAVAVQAGFLLWAGAWMLFGFWTHRISYRERYGGLAYQQLFFHFLIPFLVVGGAAVLFPLFVGGPPLLPRTIAYGLAAYCLVTVQLIERRGIEIFWDIEWRAFVYNVFPARGRVVTAGIFGWLRHPVYSAAIRSAVGCALVRNNLPALLCAALVGVGVWVLGTVEERELMQRDAEYAAYRRMVPAFFATHPARFWRYLLTGRDDVHAP